MSILGIFKTHKSTFKELEELNEDFQEEKKGIKKAIKLNKKKAKILNSFASKRDQTQLSKLIKKFRNLKKIVESEERIELSEEPINLKMIGIIEELIKSEIILKEKSEQANIRQALEKLKSKLKEWRGNLQEQEEKLMELQNYFDALMKKQSDFSDIELLRITDQFIELAKKESEILGKESKLIIESLTDIKHLMLLKTRREGLPIGITSQEELEEIGNLIADGLRKGEEKFGKRYNEEVRAEGTQAFIVGSRATGIVSEGHGERSGKPPQKNSDVDLVLVGEELVDNMLNFFKKRADEGSNEMRKLVKKVERKGRIWTDDKHLIPPGFKHAEISRVFERNTGMIIKINVQTARPDSDMGRKAIEQGIPIPIPSDL